MTEEIQPDVSGGDNTESGAFGNDEIDVVKRTAYTRAIDEVKSVKGKYKSALAELNEYKAKEKHLEEQRLLDEKKHVEVIETLKMQVDELAKANTQHMQDKLDFRKMNAAMSLMQAKGINLEQKYFGLLPIDQIEVTDDGDIDSNSVASVIDNFQKEHPRLTLPTAKLLPNDKSGSSGPMISIQEWKKLGREEKRQALKDKRVKGLIS